MQFSCDDRKAVFLLLRRINIFRLWMVKKNVNMKPSTLTCDITFGCFGKKLGGNPQICMP